MILYNLFPLLAGPFVRWGEHFKRAASMGFDWVFINPIQALGESRSLYSIADYFRINPFFLDGQTSASGDEQVREMIGQARKAGLKVMIDLVINHCAIDSPLTGVHPEWFVRTREGKVANSCCQHQGETVVWQDLAQFDHRHTRDPEGLYRYCLSVVEHLVSLGFEGLRCDAAYQVPRAFWQRLIRETKAKHRQVVFLCRGLRRTEVELLANQLTPLVVGRAPCEDCKFLRACDCVLIEDKSDAGNPLGFVESDPDRLRPIRAGPPIA